MPAELKTRLEHAATANKRSLTAEIVARLEWSLQISDAHPGYDFFGLPPEKGSFDISDEMLGTARKASVATDPESSNVTFASRLFERLEALEQSIEKKIERLEKLRDEQLSRLKGD